MSETMSDMPGIIIGIGCLFLLFCAIFLPVFVFGIYCRMARILNEVKEAREQNAQLLIELKDAVRGAAKEQAQTTFITKDERVKLPGA